jgi:hypothetical protein
MCETFIVFQNSSSLSVISIEHDEGIDRERQTL